MFQEDFETQLQQWRRFRETLNSAADPLQTTVDLWAKAPTVNKHLDPYRPATWSDPWSILKEGKYCDMTLCLMMAYTLSLTERFKDSVIEIKTYLDTDNKVAYNCCSIDNKILNYRYREVVDERDLPESMELQLSTPVPNYR
jgi:hypothetical protein